MREISITETNLQPSNANISSSHDDMFLLRNKIAIFEYYCSSRRYTKF